MLKKIEPYDRLLMLADRIETAPCFDLTDTRYCAYGWCEKLFRQELPQRPSEANVEYLARVTGMSAGRAVNIYHGMSAGRRHFLGTPEGMAAELRDVAHEMMAARV